LIGAGTVDADDPHLTVREVPSDRQPARVVVDATGRVAATSHIFGDGEVIVMTTISSPHVTKTAWKETGAEVVVVGQAQAGVDLRAVIDNLAARGWIDVYCEGGAALATSLLREDLVDRLSLHYGPLVVGEGGIGIGDLGVTTLGDAARWQMRQVESMGSDAMLVLERKI
jgi:diaminohydroxyphosphoribosylaminopyrimidine deaminase/5-amino-6-(5-phosphoribosylamino)uracil reductase